MAFMPQLNAAGTAWIPQLFDNNLGNQGVQGLLTRYGSGDVANAAAVATIPAVASQTAYITGFEVWAGGATAAILVDVTIAGLLGGSQTFPFAAPAGAALAANPLVFNFDQPLPASAANTAITVTLPALGAGNAKAAVYAKGYTA